MTTQCSFRYLDHGHSMGLAVVNVLNRMTHAILSSDSQQYVDYLHGGQVFMVIEFNPTTWPSIKVNQEFPLDAMPTALRAIFDQPEPTPVPSPEKRTAGLLNDIDSVFRFGLGDDVRIGQSSLVGVVKARSQHAHENLFYVEYNDVNGVPCTDWFNGDKLSHAGDSGPVDGA
jgi:hypothetical protein